VRAVLEFARTLGDDTPPIIIVTGRLERELHDEVMALGAAGSIDKPFRLNDLLRLLLSVVRSQS
jgi:DNA-binding response OmpR family regulator